MGDTAQPHCRQALLGELGSFDDGAGAEDMSGVAGSRYGGTNDYLPINQDPLSDHITRIDTV